MSFSSTPPENLPDDADLLKALLPPLLEDFQHWFGSTIDMLETQNIGFLTPQQQRDLLTRVRSAQREVSVSQALFAATDSQAGVDMPVVRAWHQLLHECWGIALRARKERQGNSQGD